MKVFGTFGGTKVQENFLYKLRKKIGDPSLYAQDDIERVVTQLSC